MDTLSRDFPSPGLPVSLLTSGPLSPCRVQPILNKPSAVHHTWSSSVSMPAGDSPVESDLTGSLSPLTATIPDVSSSPVVSTNCRSSHRSLSPGSGQSDGFFYSATDSPTGQAPAMHPEPTFDPSLCREGHFQVENPHPQIGDDKRVVVPTYQDSDVAVQDRHFGLQLHHPRFLEWVGAPEYARLLGLDPWERIRSMSRWQTIDAARPLQHDTCLMTSSHNVLDQYALCLQRAASKLLELVVGRQDFPSKVMDSATLVPQVCRASVHVHMEAMGLWRPPLGPDCPADSRFPV